MANEDLLKIEEKANNFVKNLEEINDELNKKLSDKEQFEIASKALCDAITSVKDELKKYVDALKEMSKPKQVKIIQDLSKNVEGWNNDIEKSISKIEKFDKEFKTSKDQISKQYDAIKSNQEDILNDIKELKESSDEANKNIIYIKEWLTENGQILLDNSRTGIFSKKK